MSWSDAEIDIILEQMREGTKVKDGVSRCYTEYSYRDGCWFARYDEMSRGEEKQSDEATVRRLIERKPELFRDMLRAPIWAEFVAAYCAGDFVAAHRHLDRVGPYKGRQDEEGIPAYRAIMDWPDAKPSEEVVGYLRDEILGFTAYHLFMGATGWDKSIENHKRGLAFVDQLGEMVGDTKGFYRLRASFLEECLQWDDALNAMMKELERTAEDDSWHQSYKDDLARMHKRIMHKQREYENET